MTTVTVARPYGSTSAHAFALSTPAELSAKSAWSCTDTRRSIARAAIGMRARISLRPSASAPPEARRGFVTSCTPIGRVESVVRSAAPTLPAAPSPTRYRAVMFSTPVGKRAPRCPSPPFTSSRPSPVVRVITTSSRGPRDVSDRTSGQSTPLTRTSRVLATPDGVGAGTHVRGDWQSSKR
jgi:hypothetical protein